LSKDQKVHIYCQRGARSEQATDILKWNGFEPVNLEGGYADYSQLSEVSGSEDSEIDLNPDRMKIKAEGLQCPGPLIKVNNAMEQLNPGSNWKSP